MSGPNFAGVPHNFAFTGTGGDKTPMSPDNQHATIPVPAGEQGNVNPGTNPLDAKIAQNQKKEGSSPLDRFKPFFDNTPKPELKPGDAGYVAPVKPKPTILDATPEMLVKTAEGLDFTKDIPETVLKPITEKLGADAAKAILGLVNHVGRQGYVQGSSLAIASAKTALDSVGPQITTADAMNAVTLREANSKLVTDHPHFAAPELNSVAQGLQKLFLSKQPDLTPTQLAELTIGYFQAGGGTPVPKKEESTELQSSIGDFFKGLS